MNLWWNFTVTYPSSSSSKLCFYLNSEFIFRKRILGTFTTSHRGVITIWNDIYIKTLPALTVITSKYRNHMQLQSVLRVAVSTIQPRTSRLVPNTQVHTSHWVSSVSHCYTISVPMVSAVEHDMTPFGRHGKIEINLMRCTYNMCIFSLTAIPKNASRPHDKQC
jgi:hypothetical protein